MTFDPMKTLEMEKQALALGERVARAAQAERLAWLKEHPEYTPHPIWDAIVDEQGRLDGPKIDIALATARENPNPSFEEEETIRTLRLLSLCSRDPFALSRAPTSF